MREWLARLLYPEMCDHKIQRLMSYKAPDTWDGEKIVPGAEISTWRTCGKRPGHDGEHGAWSRWFMYRTRIANWLTP